VKPMRARIVRFAITIIVPVLRRHGRAWPVSKHCFAPIHLRPFDAQLDGIAINFLSNPVIHYV
ncbi:hypothetical protein, partial [Burkholderia vietnamiensis]|uniref:hypothetical protein n=1 Tax=Burkholderia vietnamiensis TaxID=60552 RepID=UPI003F498E96